MTKKLLLTAAALGALAFAGAANAGTLTAQVNAVPATSTAPYTVAKERNDAVDVTGAFTLSLDIPTAAKPVLTNVGTAPANARVYDVTFNISGAGNTFDTTTPTIALVSTGGTATITSGTAAILHTANQIVFRVTVTNAHAADSATIDGFTLGGVKVSNASENNVVFSASVNDLGTGGGSLVATIDTASPTTLIKYEDAVQTFSVTANNSLLSLPTFRAFKAGTTANTVLNGFLSNEVATDFGVATVGTTTYRTGLAANITVNRDGIINGAVLEVESPVFANDKIVPSLAGLTVAATPVRTATTNGAKWTFTLNNDQADELSSAGVDLVLTQTVATAAATVIPTGSITANWRPTYAAGFASPTEFKSAPAGTVARDGVNIIAPWYQGVQGQTRTNIRLSSTAGRAAQVHLNITNGVFVYNGDETTFGSETGGVQRTSDALVIPAYGDLVITPELIQSLYGDFRRGDLIITVEAQPGEVTAKSRTVNADGSVFETSLGRASGTTVPGSAY